MINSANQKFNRIYGQKVPLLYNSKVQFAQNYPDKCSKEWMIKQNHKLIERNRQEKRDKLNAKNRITSDLNDISTLLEKFDLLVIEEEIDAELIHLAELSTNLKYDLYDLIKMLCWYNNEDYETGIIKAYQVDNLNNHLECLLNDIGNILSDIGVQRQLESRRKNLVGGRVDDSLIDIEWSLGMFINEMKNALKN